ncbi:hypothetical protein DVH05_028458 [Phytophthora capsici]|nr:hypothetical protein DVH05_028458 [Phytophthora capsici]
MYDIVQLYMYKLKATPEAQAKIDKMELVVRAACTKIRSICKDEEDVESNLEDLHAKHSKKLVN